MDDEDDIRTGPSKSQQKREMLDLQRLGEELMNLPEKQLQAIELPERLREAIELARRITSHGAHKRQRQYIGRLMRDLDPAPLRAALERLQGADRASKAHFQECERWRDRLLAEGDTAIAEFMERNPEADRPHLRRLVRQAAEEMAAGLPPRHARELFRYIHGLK